MFALAGQAFEDERFPYDVSNSQHPEFDTAQASGRFTFSMDSLPVLTFNGQLIGQSKVRVVVHLTRSSAVAD